MTDDYVNNASCAGHIQYHAMALHCLTNLLAALRTRYHLCVLVLWPQSLYLSRMTNQHGHWVCWMSTARNNGLNVKNTRTHVYCCTTYSRLFRINNAVLVLCTAVLRTSTQQPPFSEITVLVYRSFVHSNCSLQFTHPRLMTRTNEDEVMYTGTRETYRTAVCTQYLHTVYY